MQSVFRRSRHICWGTYSGRSNSQSLGGKMMRSAHATITWPPLGRLHQFGSVDLDGASSIWATCEVRWCQIRATGMMGKNLPPPSVTGVNYGASNVWPGTVQQQCSLWQQSGSVAANSLLKSGQCALITTSRTHLFTSKSFVVWSTAVISASTDMATTSKNTLHTCLYLTHVLLAVTCSYFK
jgi:hypothetical protein